jgi:hypothetical protein
VAEQPRRHEAPQLGDDERQRHHEPQTTLTFIRTMKASDGELK